MTGRIIHSNSMLDIITEYTTYSGRMNPIPDWVNKGIIVGLSGGQDKIKQIVTHLREYNIPLSAIYINDWSGYQKVGSSSNVNVNSNNNNNLSNIKQPLWNLNYDSIIYPEWNTWIYDLMGYSRKQSSTTATLKAYNDGDDEKDDGDMSNASQEYVLSSNNSNILRILVNISPFITNISSYINNNSSYDNNNENNFFEQAKNNGYLIESALENTASSFSPYLYPNENGYQVGLIDLTNPDARQWYKNKIKRQILNNGLSGKITGHIYIIDILFFSF